MKNIFINHKKYIDRHIKFGFTLIEIMVALAIVSISGIALMSNIGNATRDLSVLDDKTIALGIAEYALNSKLILPDFPDLGQEDQVIKQSNKEWKVDINVSETPNERVRRIDVMVSTASSGQFSNNPPTVLLSGFRVNLE